VGSPPALPAAHHRGRDWEPFEGSHVKMTLFTWASVVVGGALGFGYYRLVGCSSGACPITSNPYISTLYGALLGYLIGAGGRL
jgi:Family of unknown function (DUF6132)